MSDPEKIIETIQKLFKTAFGSPLPLWLLQVTALVLLGGVLLSAFLGSLVILSKIKKAWRDDFRPRFYTPEEKQHSD